MLFRDVSGFSQLRKVFLNFYITIQGLGNRSERKKLMPRERLVRKVYVNEVCTFEKLLGRVEEGMKSSKTTKKYLKHLAADGA